KSEWLRLPELPGWFAWLLHHGQGSRPHARIRGCQYVTCPGSPRKPEGLKVQTDSQPEHQPLKPEVVTQVVLKATHRAVCFLQDRELREQAAFDKPSREVVPELKPDRAGGADRKAELLADV